jgi:hypothetical protein
MVAVGGQTLTLIPLYAIGVFTAFTLAQAGLVKHWRQIRPPRWRHRAAINGTGAVTTGVATVVFLVTKFTAGAWLVVLAGPALIALFISTHRYYERAGRALGLDTIPAKPHAKPTMVLVPVTGLSELTRHALSEALSMSRRVLAVHVVVDDTGQNPERDHELHEQWARWNPGVPLRILHTEFASVARPIARFIDELHERHDEEIVVLIPVALPDRLRYRFLHNHLDVALTTALQTRPDVIVARVPMLLHADDGRARTSHPMTGTGLERTNPRDR